MKFYKIFLLLGRGKQIAVVVCAAHLLAIFCLLGHHLISGRLKPPRPMVVRTIANGERNVQNTKREAVKQPPKPAAPVKPKQPATPSPAKPKPAAPAKKLAPVTKKIPPVDEEDLFLKQIASSLQTLTEESKKPPRTALILPLTIRKKAPLTQEKSNVNPTDSEFLIAYLQNALDLPEFGEVKAKIEIDRFGKLVDLQIIEAKSVKNAQFLKTELPQLDFPTGNADSTQTFTITFRNI